MWPIDAIHRSNWSIDRLQTEQLVSGSVQLTDSVNLCDWSEEELHLFRCQYCGGDDRSGGWVSLRRSGPFLLWLPCFELIERFPLLPGEYWPPEYLESRGIPIMDRDVLCAALTEPFNPAQVAPLTTRDVVRCAQLESKGALGSLAEPIGLRRELITGVGVGDEAAFFNEFESLLREWDLGTREVQLDTDEAEPVWVGVAGADGDCSWFPAARRGGVLLLYFEPGIVATIADR